MLTIRDDQFSAFQEIAEDAFLDELCVLVRTDLAFWVENWEPDILRERVRSGIARARSHGLTGRASIARFVFPMVRFAPNFDEYPPIRALLLRQDISPEERAKRLLTDIPAKDWLAVEERFDPHAWLDFASGEVL
jgi:hypothetical protein